MKAFDLALFMFIVLSVVVCVEGILPTDISITTANSSSFMKFEIPNINFEASAISIGIDLMLAAFTCIVFILKVLAVTTALLPLLLRDLGISDCFAVMITGCVWFTYAAAVFQIWTGKTIRGSE